MIRHRADLASELLHLTALIAMLYLLVSHSFIHGSLPPLSIPGPEKSEDTQFSLLFHYRAV